MLMGNSNIFATPLVSFTKVKVKLLSLSNYYGRRRKYKQISLDLHVWSIYDAQWDLQFTVKDFLYNLS